MVNYFFSGLIYWEDMKFFSVMPDIVCFGTLLSMCEEANNALIAAELMDLYQVCLQLSISIFLLSYLLQKGNCGFLLQEVHLVILSNIFTDLKQLTSLWSIISTSMFTGMENNKAHNINIPKFRENYCCYFASM